MYTCKGHPATAGSWYSAVALDSASHASDSTWHSMAQSLAVCPTAHSVTSINQSVSGETYRRITPLRIPNKATQTNNT